MADKVGPWSYGHSSFQVMMLSITAFISIISDITLAMEVEDLKALHKGRVKNLLVDMQDRDERFIPSSVIRNGVKLPKLEFVNLMEKVKPNHPNI